jgi:hypothetical protein|tara:strand:- start:1766 stop:1969 length:204 start_codon:yes stop_codon:yes gene_type:complete
MRIVIIISIVIFNLIIGAFSNYFPDLIDKQRFLPYILWFNALGVFSLIIPNRDNDYLFKQILITEDE